MTDTPTPPQPNVGSWMADYFEGRRRRREAAPEVARQIKEILFPILKAHGLAAVTVSYDGYGDSGGVETSVLTATNGTELSPDDALWGAVLDTEADPRWTGPRFGGRLRDVVEAIADWLVETHCPGYENNDGGFGTVTLDVTSNGISHDHAWRRTETDEETFEF